MAIVEERNYMPLAMEEDPDDYRPDSELALVVDPGGPDDAVVENLTVFYERIAAGDRIPLHVHSINEVLFVDEGTLEVHLGKESRTVGARAIVFIPSFVAHGFRNVGDATAHVHAVFPAREISIRYLERNPAPGTEGQPPGPPFAVDVRELVEGEAERAVRPLEAKEISKRGD